MSFYENMLTFKFTPKAITFATKKHEGQFRKVSLQPYITHPLAVSYIVASFKKSKKLDELIAAAILHDTLEDINTTFDELTKEFSPLISSLVLELTSDKNEIKNLGKTQYLKKKLLGISSYGLTLKLCDRLRELLAT